MIKLERLEQQAQFAVGLTIIGYVIQPPAHLFDTRITYRHPNGDTYVMYHTGEIVHKTPKYHVENEKLRE